MKKSRKMEGSKFGKMIVPTLLFFCLAEFSEGLKCRTYQEVHENNDLEYVVRMCLRHMNNETDFIDQFYRNQGRGNRNRGRNRDQNDYNPYRNKNNNNNNNNNNDNYNNNNNNNNDYNGYYNNNDNNKYNRNNDNNKYNRNNDNDNYYNRNQDKGFPSGFDGFWYSRNNQQRPNDGNNDGYRDVDSGKRGSDYGDDSDDYYSSQRNRKDERNKYKSRPSYPHSYQQQMQHDRESFQGHGSRNSPNYFFSNRKQTTNMSHLNRDKNNDSPLADIEPCVIHCIFQEMKMVDDNGKPNKELISQKMTQKIRNPELKNFIRESVEECYESIENNDFGNYGNGNGWNQQGNQKEMCEWAKTFAICLENRGKDNCDDWNDPTQKNNNNSNNSDRKKNNGNNNKNNSSNNNNNGGKKNENSKNKSKQNEMG